MILGAGILNCQENLRKAGGFENIAEIMKELGRKNVGVFVTFVLNFTMSTIFLHAMFSLSLLVAFY